MRKKLLLTRSPTFVKPSRRPRIGKFIHLILDSWTGFYSNVRLQVRTPTRAERHDRSPDIETIQQNLVELSGVTSHLLDSRSDIRSIFIG